MAIINRKVAGDIVYEQPKYFSKDVDEIGIWLNHFDYIFLSFNVLLVFWKNLILIMSVLHKT